MIDAITYALLKGDIGQGTQEAVTEYLDEHLTNPSNPPIDTSLEISGAAADSKTTGDKITQLKEDFTDIETRVSNLDGLTNVPLESGNISYGWSALTYSDSTSRMRTPENGGIAVSA